MNKNEGNTSTNELENNEQSVVNSGKREPNKIVIIIVVVALVLATCFAALIFIGRNRDVDGDGLTSVDEKNMGTDVANTDTDGDTLSDYYEVKELKTNPTSKDTDEDGVTDDYEVNNISTDPLVADTDEDGLMDGEAVEYGTDPLVADSDEDGLFDGDEINEYGTDPTMDDTDGDGLLDGQEINDYGIDPLSYDTDGDGTNDSYEFAMGTDPLVYDEPLNDTPSIYEPTYGVIDSDGDNLNDDEELLVYDTDPNNPDTDGDGINDGVVILEGDTSQSLSGSVSAYIEPGTYTVTTTADTCEISWGIWDEYEYVVRSGETLEITVEEEGNLITMWGNLPDGETVTFTPVLD